MNVLSLFSGIGGLDLGLERAGMTVVGQVEIDPWCRQVLAKHWPEVPRHDDVRTAAGWWLGDVADAIGTGLAQREGQPGDDGTQLPAAERGSRDGTATAAAAARGRPAVDLVAGGFPCQPVSLAGKGLAQADSRWLWPAFADVIRALRPRYALLENVPGLLGRGMGDVLGDLAGLGYDAEWDCVPAAYVGAPHIRNRVWIVAYPQRHARDARRAGNPSEGTRGRDASRSAIGAHVADAADCGRDDPRLDRGSPQTGDHAWPPLAGEPGGSCRALADADREPLGWPPEPRCERGHWAAEPGVGRVAHGIPRRVDRLRGLGNAVVPQVAEHIGRLIMDAASP